MLLKNNTTTELHDYLVGNNWITENENIIRITKAGEGNMNYVVRVQTNKKSFICKQSAPYVEKYPQISAPENRVQTEALFYQKIKKNQKIKKMMPELLGVDTQNNILFLEDLGAIQDFSSLYELKMKLLNSELLSLTEYLNELHSSFKKENNIVELENLELRKLNYEHIFKYPFLDNNGFDLDTIQPGLQELAKLITKNSNLKTAIAHLGTRYLENGKYLLHGDFYPGSWFNNRGKIMVIDPEFCYYGQREFDLGVLLAHLYLTNHKTDAIDLVKNNYIDYQNLNHHLLDGFTGVEILRRIIGLAQLPLKMDLVDKKKLLEKAQYLILNK